MSAHVPVAVVIVTWNCERYLADCLDSLLALERVPQEIVVVDNASTDGAVESVRRDYPGVRLIEVGGNLGFCRANNLGIQATHAPFILVLNPDTRLEPRFLEELLPAFDDPHVGLAAGKLLRFDGETLDSCGQLLARSRQPVDRGYGQNDRGQFDQDAVVFGVCGAAALYRRSMLESIADPDDVYFDERFFAFYEDLDLAWRARRLGWITVYRHAAVGYHARGGTARGGTVRRRFAAMLGRSSELRFHIAKNRYLTILRNDEVGRYLTDAPFIWTRDVATILLLSLTSPAVLVRLWRERQVFFDVAENRRLDSQRRRDEVGPRLTTGASGDVISDGPDSHRVRDGDEPQDG
jgi:GT2 family glycosyltransferase